MSNTVDCPYCGAEHRVDGCPGESAVAIEALKLCLAALTAPSKAGRPATPAKTIKSIERAIKRGDKYADIAAAAGVSVKTVCRAAKAMKELKSPPAPAQQRH